MTEEPGVGTTADGAQEVGQEPGTPASEAADGKEPESGPQLAEVIAENERLKRLHDEHLREKSNLESERQRYREWEAAQGNQQPTASQAQLQEEFQALIQDANSESVLKPYARVIGAILLQNQQLRQDMTEQFGYVEVPPEKRADVQRVVKEAAARGERISPKTAAALIDGSSASAKAEELAKREKELNEREAALKAGRVSTREMPAPPAKGDSKIMTQMEYGQKMAKYREAGDTEAADALYLKKLRGEISVT